MSNLLDQLQACCRDQSAFERLLHLLNSQNDPAQLQQQALFRVVAEIRASLDLETIFHTTAVEVRRLLAADRVGMFRFYAGSSWSDGEFVSEDVLPQFPSAMAARIHDHCFGDTYAIEYQKGRIQAVADIYQAGLRDCHIEVLARFQIRANLVVPLLQGDALWGLLCIHQCAAGRTWQPHEIEFVEHIATHLSVALQQAELLARSQHQATELAAALENLKHSQTRLIQSEKMAGLGQLVAGVAHEINNPVNFIHGNLVPASQYAQDLIELLRLYEAEVPNPSKKLLDRIQSIDLDFLIEDFPKILASMQIGADRIRQIVLSLRNFSRLDEAIQKPVDIHEGLDSTLLILQHRLKTKSPTQRIKVFKEYGNLPPVECYPSQLNQVFMNLLSNAIDALEFSEDASTPTHRSPQITIQTQLIFEQTAAVPRVLISIADNGVGIPTALQPKLFDPFFTTKPVGKGTGLGLSISYQIVVDRHGGSLTCASHPDRGTEFQIEIPLYQQQLNYCHI